jgi:uncharacterized membrane protein
MLMLLAAGLRAGAHRSFRRAAAARSWMKRCTSLLLGSTLCDFRAIGVPLLAEVDAIAFIVRLLVAVFAVWSLRERVTRDRWLAIAAGFAGVLFIVRPGGATLSWASGLARAGTRPLSPFGYTRLVGMTLLGCLLFGDVRGEQAVIGAALIVGRGLLVAWGHGARPREAPDSAIEQAESSQFGRFVPDRHDQLDRTGHGGQATPRVARLVAEQAFDLVRPRVYATRRGHRETDEDRAAIHAQTRGRARHDARAGLRFRIDRLAEAERSARLELERQRQELAARAGPRDYRIALAHAGPQGHLRSGAGAQRQVALIP